MENNTPSYKQRLQSFYDDVIMDVVHHYFESKILGNKSFQSFLEENLHILFHKREPRKRCCECSKTFRIDLRRAELEKYQFDLLYVCDDSNLAIKEHTHADESKECLQRYTPNMATVSEGVVTMDICLICILIKSCCLPGTFPGDPRMLENIKRCRHFISHLGTQFSENVQPKLEENWKLLESSVLELAQTMGKAYEHGIKRRISSFASRNALIKDFSCSVAEEFVRAFIGHKENVDNINFKFVSTEFRTNPTQAGTDKEQVEEEFHSDLPRMESKLGRLGKETKTTGESGMAEDSNLPAIRDPSEILESFNKELSNDEANKKKDDQEENDEKPRISYISSIRCSVSTENDNILSEPFFLQRPPSFLSIRESISRRNTDNAVLTDTQILENDEIPSPSRMKPEDSADGDTFSDLLTDSSSFERSMLTSTVDHTAEGTGRCIECVKAIPVFSEEEIEIGDHITFAGAIYDHHAIVINKLSINSFEVIEPTNKSVSFSKLFGQTAKLVSSRQTFDFAKQNIRVIFYKKRRFSKLETVKRAKEFLTRGNTKDQPTAPYEDNLFNNNCEHFATYCVTGEIFSIPVTEFPLTGRLFLSSGFIGISDEKKRNERKFVNKIICSDCFKLNEKLLDVPVREVSEGDDIQKGDIIRYSYWNLWHEAVVLEISEVKDDCVKCFIAHYALCGFFSRRTIKKELLSVKFDGRFYKLKYEPPAFHVYDPETVVQRAKERLKEQMFNFLSNDSSHYARWCKLKLIKRPSHD